MKGKGFIMELKKNPEELENSGVADSAGSVSEGQMNYGGLDSTYGGGNDEMPFFDPAAEFDPVSPMVTAGMNSGIDNGNSGAGQQPAGYYNGDNYNTYNSGVGGGVDRYHFEGEAPKRKLTKKEFLNKMALRKLKDKINYSGIALIACGIISIIATWFIVDTVLKPMYQTLDSMSKDFGMDVTDEMPNLSALLAGVVIVDLIIVGLGIGIMIGQSRVCAGIALALSAYNMISSIVQTHRFTGYLPFIASIYAVYATVEFNNAWKQYDTTGHYPGVD